MGYQPKPQRQTKKQRELKRTEKANTWKDGFNSGYLAGYSQAEKDCKPPLFSDDDWEWIKTGKCKPIAMELKANVNLEEFKKSWEELGRNFGEYKAKIYPLEGE